MAVFVADTGKVLIACRTCFAAALRHLPQPAQLLAASPQFLRERTKIHKLVVKGVVRATEEGASSL